MYGILIDIIIIPQILSSLVNSSRLGGWSMDPRPRGSDTRIVWVTAQRVEPSPMDYATVGVW